MRAAYWTSPLLDDSSCNSERLSGPSDVAALQYERLAAYVADEVTSLTKRIGGDSFTVSVVTQDTNLQHAVGSEGYRACLLVDTSTNALRSLIHEVFEIARTQAGGESWTKQVMVQAETPAKFISAHESLRGGLDDIAQHKSWSRILTSTPLSRGFCDVVANQDAITAAFADTSALGADATSERAAQARAAATDAVFWLCAKSLIKLLEPLAACLDVVSDEEATRSSIFQALLALRSHAAYCEPIHGLPRDIQASIRALIEGQWGNLCARGFTGTAFLLDPHCDIAALSDGDRERAISAATDALFTASNAGSGAATAQYKHALDEFVKEKMGWTAAEREQHRKRSAYQWWLDSTRFPMVRDLALRVFSIPTSDSEAKQIHRQSNAMRERYTSGVAGRAGGDAECGDGGKAGLCGLSTGSATRVEPHGREERALRRV